MARPGAYDLVRPALPRGTWTLRAGGMLMGLAIVHGLTLAFAGGIGAPLAFGELTHGALLLVGGIVTLIVGGVQRASSSDR